MEATRRYTAVKRLGLARGRTATTERLNLAYSLALEDAEPIGPARRPMVKNPELLSRITARPDIFGGKPIVRDMRISVELILSLLSQGVAPSEILDDYPELEPEDIRTCTAYAHAVISSDTLSAVSVAES